MLAQEEARLLQHGFIGTEHILLGLIDVGDGVAARALAGLQVNAESVRAKVEEVLADAPRGSTGSPPFTPRAKKVLELSLREALQLNHDYIGTEHMLLGLLREGDGVAVAVLVGMGIDLATVRERVMHVLEFEPDSPHETSRGNWPIRRTTRAGRASGSFVGNKWSGVVVRAGRLPSDYASAFEDLAVLTSEQGVDIQRQSARRTSSSVPLIPTPVPE